MRRHSGVQGEKVLSSGRAWTPSRHLRRREHFSHVVREAERDRTGVRIIDPE